MENTKREKLSDYMTRLASQIIKLQDLLYEADEDDDITVHPCCLGTHHSRYSYQLTHKGFLEFAREFGLAYTMSGHGDDDDDKLLTFRWAGVVFYALFTKEEYEEAFNRENSR